jgi:hypothetical protein
MLEIVATVLVSLCECALADRREADRAIARVAAPERNG